MPRGADPSIVAGSKPATKRATKRAKGPRRDARGRFKRRRGNVRKGGRPSSGIRGPSYYASKTPLALARMLVRLEHEVGRLEAEGKGRLWADPPVEMPSRMKGIRADQTSSVGKQLAALKEVLRDMAVERLPPDMPKRHEEIARRVAVKLGKPFPWRTLYRQPYLSRWQQVEDWLGRVETDEAAGLRDRVRWSKPQLVHAIRRTTALRNRLLAEGRERLLSEAGATDWEPIRNE